MTMPAEPCLVVCLTLSRASEHTHSFEVTHLESYMAQWP
jgi:hypothetical protein